MKALFPGIVEGLLYLGVCLTHSIAAVNLTEPHSGNMCEVACHQIAACCTFEQESCKNLTRISTSSATEAFQISGKWSEILGGSCSTYSLAHHRASRRFDCVKSSAHPHPAANLTRVLAAPVSDNRLVAVVLYQLHLYNLTKTKYLHVPVDVKGMAYVTSMKRLLIATHLTLLSYHLDSDRVIDHHYLPGILSLAIDQDRRILFLIRRQNANYFVTSFSVEGNEIKSVLEGYKPTSIVIHSSQGRFFIAVRSTIKSFDYNGKSVTTVVGGIGQIHVLTIDPLEKNLYYCVTYLLHSSLYRFPLLTARKRKIKSFTSPMTNLLFHDETLAVYTLNRKGDIYFLDLEGVKRVPVKKVQIFGESYNMVICLVH